MTQTLGGLTVPDDSDGQGWHDLAEQRAAVEGIPSPWSAAFAANLAELGVPVPTPDKLAEVDAILTRHGITMAAIAAEIDAEQDGIVAGTIVPIRHR